MSTTPMPPKKSRRLRNWLIGLGLAITALIGSAVGHAARVAGTSDIAAIPSTVSSPAAPVSGTGSSPSRPGR